LTKKVPEKQHRIWVLLGAHAGDNNQVIALAEALQLPFEVKQLEYNRLRWLGPRLLGHSLISLTRATRRLILREPPPDLTISVGHRSVPLVQNLRRRSGGRMKSIHIGFPRISPGCFDLVITTPQYPVPDHPNLLRIPYSLTRAAIAAAGAEEDALLVGLPRPRRLLIVGGDSLYWKLDEARVFDALSGIIADCAERGGSVIVTTSPRSPAFLGARMAERLRVAGVPWLVAAPGEAPNYQDLLAAADSIHVTADSVAMVSDAIWTGKPIALVPVVTSGLRKLLIAAADRIAPGRRLRPLDLRYFWAGLDEIGIGPRLATPSISTDKQLRKVLARVHRTLD